ncbi:MAG TPA: hypothetical protein PKZ42_01825 [Syntrophales bacterium]|nr:hypothetical protein [Syntrophales bacterium]
MAIYVDPNTGKMQQGKSGAYTIPINEYTPAKTVQDDDFSKSASASDSASKNNISKVIYNADGTREVVDEVDNYYQNKKPMSDEDWQEQQDTIKENTANKVQSAIDAIKSSYASVYARAAEEAKNRLGSTATINALAGQRGTPSGAANRAKTTAYNQSVEEGITADMNAEIDNIRRYYEGLEQNEIQYQQQLRREDADKWIEYMKGEKERKQTTTKAKLEDILNMGASFDQLDEDLQQEYADLYGYDIPTAQKSWDYKIGQALAEKEAKEEEARQKAKEQELANAKSEADIIKTYSDIELNQIEQEYKQNQDKTELDKTMALKGYKYISTPYQRDQLKNQGYDIVEVGGRTYAAKPEAKGGGSGTDSNTYTLTLDTLNSSKGEDGYVSTDVYKTERAKINSVSGREDFDKMYAYLLNPNDKTAQAFVKKIEEEDENENRFTASNIPQDVLLDLMEDIDGGASLQQIIKAYPDVSTSYLNTLYYQ